MKENLSGNESEERESDLEYIKRNPMIWMSIVVMITTLASLVWADSL